MVSVRLNPEVGAGHHSHVVTGARNTKFGLLEADALTTYKMAKDAGVKKFGIQMHMASGILDFKPYERAMERLLKAAADIRRTLDIGFEFMDIGGGFGVPYRPEEEALDLEKTAESIVALFKKRTSEYDLGEPMLCIEPGRYIVCDSTVLLTRVNTVKSTGTKEFIGVDTDSTH